MSLTRKAERTAGDQDDGRQQDDRMPGAGDDPGIDEPEEAGEPQIGDDDHHAQQQDDRVEVDCLGDFVERQRADRHHQARADQGGAGAVEPEAGQPADGQHQISHREDGNSRDFRQRAEQPGGARKP